MQSNQDIKIALYIPDEVMDGLVATITNTITDALVKNISAIQSKSRLLTRKEVCSKLRISLPTLARYEKLGRIKSHRMGRKILYDEGEVELYLKNVR